MYIHVNTYDAAFEMKPLDRFILDCSWAFTKFLSANIEMKVKEPCLFFKKNCIVSLHVDDTLPLLWKNSEKGEEKNLNLERED